MVAVRLKCGVRVMRIVIFGAAGTVGRRIVDEALSRGQAVTAVVRNRARSHAFPAGVVVQIGDASNVDDVTALSGGQDVVISATRSATSNVAEVVATTRALMDGLAVSGARLLIVGGAASLVVPGSNGRTVLDDARYLAPAFRSVGEASRAQYLACLSETRVDWVYLSPPAQLEPGERTGQYRLGLEQLLIDSEGHSRISIEDLAVVLLDEAMRPRYHQCRFTAAY